MRRVAAALAVMAGSAHADNERTSMYFTQSVGVSDADGGLAASVGHAMRTQAGLGARLHWLAFEAWIASDTQTDRVGAFQGFIGGEPSEGRTDLASYGIALKGIVPLYRAPDSTVEAYGRVAAGIASTTGALEGYRGHTLGAAGGLQVRGTVRALGFLWGPLFFMKKGPKITGAMYVEYGRDAMSLRMQGAPALRSGIGHVMFGFAVGTGF
jgi:hypothetical protein